MTTTKKLTAILLCIAMLLSIGAANSFAYEIDDTPISKVSFEDYLNQLNIVIHNRVYAILNELFDFDWYGNPEPAPIGNYFMAAIEIPLAAILGITDFIGYSIGIK